MRPPSLLFLHVPKTGGTTLRNIMANQFANDTIFSIGSLINEGICKFRDLAPQSRKQIRLLQGHMAFGLHRYMDPPTVYFTLLRNPVDRVLSDYYYVKTHRLHPLHGQVAAMSLCEYLQSGLTGQLDNGQTRLLCGDCEPGQPGIPSLRSLQARDLEVAVENLKTQFILVGLQERFDESVILLKRKLGWKLPLYVKANVSKARSRANPLNESDRRLIEQHNILDIQLYHAAEQLFREQMAAEGVGFKLNLIAFKLLNKLYQVYHRIRYGMQARIRIAITNLARRLKKFV